jgi:hypothetical protein
MITCIKVARFENVQAVTVHVVLPDALNRRWPDCQRSGQSGSERSTARYDCSNCSARRRAAMFLKSGGNQEN